MNETNHTSKCLNCHNQISMNLDMREEFHQYVYERLKSKTGRLSEEARKDLSTFLTTIPLRILSKPIRFGSEYTQLNKEVKQHIEKISSSQLLEEIEYQENYLKESDYDNI